MRKLEFLCFKEGTMFEGNSVFGGYRKLVAVGIVVLVVCGACGTQNETTSEGVSEETSRLQGQIPLAHQESGRSQQPYMENMRLVGSQDIENRGENGNLGWLGDCAYVAGYYGGKDRLAGMAVIDASNPSNPELVKLYPGTPGTRESQVEANETRSLVVVMPFSHRATPYGDPPGPSLLQIYDASDDCLNPILVGTYDFNDGEVPGNIVTHEHRISDDGKTIYATALASDRSDPVDALMAIDVTDPSQPNLIATWDLSHEPGMPNSGMHDLDLSSDGNRAYTNTYWHIDNVRHQGLSILDLSEVQGRQSDPEIRRISSFNWGPPENFGITHSAQLVKIKGREYVIAMDETMGADARAPWGWSRIIDVTEEEYPLQISTIRLAAAEEIHAEQTDQDGAIYGSHYIGVDDPFNTSLAFFSWYASGLRAWDIRDPYQPKEIGYYIPGAKLDTKLAVGAGYPNPKVDYVYSFIRYRPETGHIWFNSVFGGFHIVELIENPLRMSLGGN